MLRIAAIVGLALATLGGAVAGTVVPIDLNTTPVGIGTCTTLNCTPTVSPTTTGLFKDTLFTSIDASAPPPTPSVTPQTVGPTSFILDAQTNSPFSSTYISPNTGGVKDTSILVDLGTCTGVTAPTTACGLFNVDDLYTMIQGNNEAFGFQGITLTLNGVAADGSTPITGTIDLTAGIDYRSTSSLGLVSCTDANSNNPTNNTSTACTNQTSDTASVTGTDSSPGGTLSGASVVTFNNGFGAQTKSGTNYYLDVQELELGTSFLGGYLDSITITNVSPSTGTGRVVFSGLTADQISAVPEPGTVALLGIGLGLIAFWRIRSRRNRLPVLD